MSLRSAVLAAACAAVSSSALGAPAAPYQGEGAQRLAAGAVKFAHANWKADACVYGVTVKIDTSMHSVAPGPSTVYLNVFTFLFSTPETKRFRYEVSIKEADGAPHNHPSGNVEVVYNTYGGRQTD